MLRTWQKFGLFYVLAGVRACANLVSLMLGVGIFTRAVGAVGGLGQVYVRAVIAYSSLVHAGWISAVCTLNFFFFFFYFVLYAIILFGFFIIAHTVNLGLVFGRTGGWSGKLATTWIMFLVCISSLIGLPPFLGAFLKLTGIIILGNFTILGLSVLLLRSVVGLFYYLRILFRVRLETTEIGFSGNLSLKGSLVSSRSLMIFVMLNIVLGLPFFIRLGLLL